MGPEVIHLSHIMCLFFISLQVPVDGMVMFNNKKMLLIVNVAIHFVGHATHVPKYDNVFPSIDFQSEPL